MSASSKPGGGNLLLSAALEYAQRGWPVFPLHTPRPDGKCSCSGLLNCKPGKHPRTPKGVNDSTTVVGRIRDWWTRWPDANIGIATGSASGIVVLDIDPAHGGADSLRELQTRHGILPVTLVSLTGGGGQHLFFAHPGNGIDIRNSVGLAGFPGLDVRGDGGYVVAPISLHVSGQKYEWEESPHDTPLAQLPAFLIPLLQRPTRPADRPATCSIEGKIPKGQRNATLTSLAGTLHRRRMSPSAIEGALQKDNEVRCDPPLPAAEVKSIVRSVTRYPISANTANQGAPSEECEPPTPFHEIDLPPFPTETLPQWLRQQVEALAEATQTPPDLPAMLALSVCAAACSKRVVVQVTDGYQEPLNLFTVTVLPPGNRKSAVFREMTTPLEEYEKEECRRMGPEVAEARARYKILEGRLKKAQDSASKARLSEQEGDEQEAMDLARKLAETKVPVEPRFLADDTTPERLATLLRDQGGRMAVMSAEGGIFDLMAGRYSGNGSPNFDVYLKGHAGDTFRVDRVGRPPEFVQAPALTLGLTVQPDVILGLAAKPGFRGRGLLGRFLYSLPKSLLGRRKASPPPLPDEVRFVYAQKVRQLLQIRHGLNEEGHPYAHQIRLSLEASRRLVAFQEALEPQLAETGDLGHISDWAGKLVGTVARIAGILHMAEHVYQEAPWDLPVSSATIANAIRIGEYLTPHARAAFAEMGADPVMEQAKYLLRWIKRMGSDTFTKRDAFEGTKGRFKKVAALEPPLELLEQHGYIRKRPMAGHLGPGRPASPIYEVTPHLLSQNSHNSQNSETRDVSANCANSASVEGKPNPNPPPSGAPEDDRERFSL